MKLQSLRDLEIYKHAVDGGSLRAAARALNLSPTVVSRRVAGLEAALGTPLLLRSTRSMQVTPRGEQFYRRCVAILDQVCEAESELSPSQAALTGTLRVSIPTGFAFLGFLREIGAFLDANPCLALEVYLCDQPVDLRADGLDVVVHPGNQRDSVLLSRRLGTVQMLLLATPSYVDAAGVPAAPEDLLSHRCLRFRADRQQDVWRLTGPDGTEHAVRVGGNFFCDNSAALAQALYAGLGVGFLEISQGRAAIARGELVQILPTYHVAAFGIYATYAREGRSSGAVRAFLALITDFLAAAEERAARENV